MEDNMNIDRILELIENPDMTLEEIAKGMAKIMVRDGELYNVEENEGIKISAKKAGKKYKVKIVVKKGYKSPFPLYSCFRAFRGGVVQDLDVDLILEENSELIVISMCSFPMGEKVKHIMKTNLVMKKNSKIHYIEAHYHGLGKDVHVKTIANVKMGENTQFKSEFIAIKGRLGKLEIKTDVDAGKNSVVDITTKTYAYHNDVVTIDEIVKLNGENARAIVKSRGAAQDQSKIFLNMRVEGNAPNTKGHIDCAEVVKDEAQIENIPAVVVRDKTSRVTHEAAIGSVDKKQLETLLAKGLDEDEATEIIIRGIINE